MPNLELRTRRIFRIPIRLEVLNDWMKPKWKVPNSVLDAFDFARVRNPAWKQVSDFCQLTSLPVLNAICMPNLYQIPNCRPSATSKRILADTILRFKQSPEREDSQLPKCLRQKRTIQPEFNQQGCFVIVQLASRQNMLKTNPSSRIGRSTIRTNSNPNQNLDTAHSAFSKNAILNSFIQVVLENRFDHLTM